MARGGDHHHLFVRPLVLRNESRLTDTLCSAKDIQMLFAGELLSGLTFGAFTTVRRQSPAVKSRYLTEVSPPSDTPLRSPQSRYGPF